MNSSCTLTVAFTPTVCGPTDRDADHRHQRSRESNPDNLVDRHGWDATVVDDYCQQRHDDLRRCGSYHHGQLQSA